MAVKNPHYGIQWVEWVKIRYDRTHKNVSRVSFYYPNETPFETMDFEYDYSKKPKAQFHGDQRLHRFLYLLRYLNVVPDLNPEHLLIKSILTTDQYPGNSENVYSDHKFDKWGRLISYHKNGDFWSNETWQINWKCFNGRSSHLSN